MTENLVTVRTFQKLTEAETARMLLEGEGLSAFLLDTDIVNFNWFLSSAVGYIKLKVPEAEAARAMELLERIPESGRCSSDEDGENCADLSTCLSCGAEMAEDETKCSACGWTFEVGED